MSAQSIREFQAAQAASVIVKVMNSHQLNMTPRLLALRDPRFGDMVKLAITMLREAGHEEDAKRIEEMPLRPLRYLCIQFSKTSDPKWANAEVVKPA